MSQTIALSDRSVAINTANARLISDEVGQGRKIGLALMFGIIRTLEALGRRELPMLAALPRTTQTMGG